jgi:hypothetical protein
VTSISAPDTKTKIPITAHLIKSGAFVKLDYNPLKQFGVLLELPYGLILVETTKGSSADEKVSK